MLETTNFESIDVGTPFSGAIADYSCGNVKSAPESKAFTGYSDILQTICRRLLRIGWTEPETRRLKGIIRNFKDHARIVFEHYRVFALKPSRWHWPGIQVRFLRCVGSIEYRHASHYENAQKMFRRAYQRTFKRNGSVLNETLNLLGCQSSLSIKSEPQGAKCNANQCRVVSIQENNTCLISSGGYVLCGNLQNILKYGVDIKRFSRFSLSLHQFL